ncbi:MAG: hypothetical protein Q9217_004206 [Psora testacea]
MAVVGKYMETFVKEAIARAAFERHDFLEKGGAAGGIEAGDEFLETCHVQRPYIDLGLSRHRDRDDEMWDILAFFLLRLVANITTKKKRKSIL